MRLLLTALLVLLPSVASARDWWLGGGSGGGSGSQTPITQSVDYGGFDITNLDDITMDDLTADVITASSFSSTCTGDTCGNYLAETTSPTADGTNLKLVSKVKNAAIVQPSAGGSAAFTASAANSIITGSGDVEFGPLLWGVSSGDGSCAAAGTIDASPDCGQEIASNYGLTCVTVINFTVIAVPADATCTALITGSGKFAVLAR